MSINISWILGIAAIIMVTAFAATAITPSFSTKELHVITSHGQQHEFTVEVADSRNKQEHGLKKRKHMPADHGMLFIFKKPMEISMWMQDTYIPLDMVFIKPDGYIGKIVAYTTPLSLDSITSTESVISVLELNAGICKKLGIQVNDKVELQE